MDVLDVDGTTFCVPRFNETPQWNDCLRQVSHIGTALKYPKISVRIRDPIDLVAYALIHPPLSPIEAPLAMGLNYEPNVSDDGIELSGNPQEAAEEVMKELGWEIKYDGIVEAPEDDELMLAYGVWYASIFNKRLKLTEKDRLKIDDVTITDLREFSNEISSMVYSLSSKVYSTIYQTHRVSPDGEAMAVPIVITYDHPLLAAAYASHRHLPMIHGESSGIDSMILEITLDEFYATGWEGDDDYEEYMFLQKIDINVLNFLRRHVPLRIVYFSRDPVVHGHIYGGSLLGDFVSEFWIPTDDLQEALGRISFGLAPGKRGEVGVIRTISRPELTAYVPSARRSVLASEGKIKLLELFSIHLEKPQDITGEGLDLLEKILVVHHKTPSKREVMKFLEDVSFLVFDGPYRKKIDTTEGPIELPKIPAAASEVLLDRPFSVSSVAPEIPIEVVRRYFGFLVQRFLRDYNFPAAMASASNLMKQFHDLNISRKKAFLMRVLAKYIQGIGTPEVVVHKEDPIRIAENISMIFNAAIDRDLGWLEEEAEERRNEIGKRVLDSLKKKS